MLSLHRETVPTNGLYPQAIQVSCQVEEVEVEGQIQLFSDIRLNQLNVSSGTHFHIDFRAETWGKP